MTFVKGDTPFTRKELHRDYAVKGMFQNEIAEKWGVTRKLVKSRMDEWGIHSRLGGRRGTESPTGTIIYRCELCGRFKRKYENCNARKCPCDLSKARKQIAYKKWMEREENLWRRKAYWTRMGADAADSLKALYEEQGGRCALTGRKLNPELMHLDHTLPVARGGCDEISNRQWLDRQVNRAKRDLTDEEFISLCREVVSWADGS